MPAQSHIPSRCPGSLPNIFTGLQIAMIAAGEMIAAQYGLGFLLQNRATRTGHHVLQAVTFVS